MLPLRGDPAFSGVDGERSQRPDGFRVSSGCAGHVHARQISLLRGISALEGKDTSVPAIGSVANKNRRGALTLIGL